VVELVAEEPPQHSFPPLVIDAEDEEPILPPLLPQLRRQPALPPVVDPIVVPTVEEDVGSPSLIFDASRPDEEIARAQEKSQRRRGWRSRRERSSQPKAAPAGTYAAGQEWRQRILAREARPFLLLLLTAFLLLIGMWVLAVRGSASPALATPLSAEQQGTLESPSTGVPGEVPDVVGQTLAAARLVLDASAFIVDVKQAQSARPEGEIVAQNPTPGATAAAGSPVTVTVSAGQGQVPNVVGQNVAIATGHIEAAGFEVERRARIDRARAGKVIEQQPKPGTRAGKGSVVVVFFGRAPAAAALPNVVGQTQSEARAVLADKGYGVRIRYSYAASPTGNVIKSAPAAGKKLTDGDTVTLTVSLGPRTKITALTPVSPATGKNGEIAYVVVASGKGEIYLAKPDGSSRQNLSGHPGDDRNPSFAPTGLQLAFQSDRAGNFDIYSRPTSGQGLRRLTTAVNDEREPAWSPQGQRIAYVSKEGDFYALYTMATDGSGKTKVIGGQRSWRNPSWSPDGQRLIVAGGNSDDYNIFVIAASGGTPRQVAGSADYDIDPIFSPNGRRVLFSSNRDGDYDLYSVALTGGAATRLTAAAGDDTNPSYSPDGKRIVFQSTRQGLVAIYTMPAAGGSAQRVAPGQAPSWQPSS
jgi:TolB protein